jgi:hypothetical protein
VASFERLSLFGDASGGARQPFHGRRHGDDHELAIDYVQREVAGPQRPREGACGSTSEDFRVMSLGYGAAFCRKRVLSGIF